jgi:conjugal transfer/type IV secretion protein DotA/TraY
MGKHGSSWWRRVLQLGLLAGLVDLILWPMLAHAQVSPGIASAQSIQPYLSATPSSDLSTSVLTAAIGKFFSSPFSQIASSPGSTLLSSVFVIFNTAVFAVGVAFASYGIGSGIVQSAHEGQVLGKRMSAVWMPIRMSVGIGGLAPIFGGYNLAQAVMMFMATLGIGIANYMYTGLLGGTNGLESLVSPSFVAPVSGGDTFKQAAYQIFVDQVCMDAYITQNGQAQAMGATIPSGSLQVSTAPSTGTMQAQVLFGTADNPTLCGSVSVQSPAADATNGQTGSSFGGYRVNSVNYAQITQETESAYAKTFPAFVTNVEALANNWYQADQNAQLGTGSGTSSASLSPTSSGASTGVIPAFPLSDLDAQASAFADSVSTSLGADASTTSQGGAIMQSALSNMMAGGWFNLGGWYGTFAEVQSAINQAAAQVKLVGQAPSAAALSIESIHDLAVRMQTLIDQAVAPSAAAGSFGSTPTGNSSWGQALVTGIIRIGVNGSAGSSGGAFSGNLTMAGLPGNFPVVNPVIMSKNMGDWMMVTAEAGTVATTLLSGSVTGLAGPAAEIAAPASGLLGRAVKFAGDKAMSLATGGVVKLHQLMTAIFLVGALFSLYIPMIPFIHWWGGLTQYVVSVFEGLAASPLWAFAHLDAEGEGMGQKAERGYLFGMNMLFRPALMVIGFVLAAAVVTPLGSVLVYLFVQAMANAQGNSVTGVASVIGYLIIFFVMMSTLVGTVFNAITVLPDQIIGWVGHATGMQLGKEVEGRVNQMFVGAYRTVGMPVVAPKPGKSKTGGGDAEKQK